MRKLSKEVTLSERGDGESPLRKTLQATFCVAREDRDGGSRYRASKMPAFVGELGWYRDYRRPYGLGAAFFHSQVKMHNSKLWCPCGTYGTHAEGIP